MSCSIWGCSNSSPSTADPAIHYYVFPKHPIIARNWAQACGCQPEEMDSENARICSIHFADDSYTTELKTADNVTYLTRILKYDAVPTLFLPLTTEVMIKEADVKELVVFKQTEDKVDVNKYKHIQTQQQLQDLEKSNKETTEYVQKLEQELINLKAQLNERLEVYKMRDLELSNVHEQYLKEKRTMLSMQKQKMLLKKVFSEPQIKILSGKRKIYWSDDDMAVGYIIRHLSNRRCYVYLTKKLNIPLPAMSSIKRWMNLKAKDVKSLPKQEDSD